MFPTSDSTLRHMIDTDWLQGTGFTVSARTSYQPYREFGVEEHSSEQCFLRAIRDFLTIDLDIRSSGSEDQKESAVLPSGGSTVDPLTKFQDSHTELFRSDLAGCKALNLMIYTQRRSIMRALKDSAPEKSEWWAERQPLPWIIDEYSSVVGEWLPRGRPDMTARITIYSGDFGRADFTCRKIPRLHPRWNTQDRYDQVYLRSAGNATSRSKAYLDTILHEALTKHKLHGKKLATEVCDVTDCREWAAFTMSFDAKHDPSKDCFEARDDGMGNANLLPIPAAEKKGVTSDLIERYRSQYQQLADVAVADIKSSLDKPASGSASCRSYRHLDTNATVVRLDDGTLRLQFVLSPNGVVISAYEQFGDQHIVKDNILDLTAEEKLVDDN